MRDLDAALARNVKLEVDAKHWRIRSGQWRAGIHYAEHRDVDADLARFLIVGRDYPNYPPTPGATPSRNPPSGVGGFPSASYRHADPTDPT